MPMTVEYRNGVQSSTISYSNMEGLTNKRFNFGFPAVKLYWLHTFIKGENLRHDHVLITVNI